MILLPSQLTPPAHWRTDLEDVEVDQSWELRDLSLSDITSRLVWQQRSRSGQAPGISCQQSNLGCLQHKGIDLGFWFQWRIMLNISTILRVSLSLSPIQSFPPCCSVFSQAMSTLESGQKHSSDFLSNLRNFRVLSVLISNKVMDKVNVSLHFYILIKNIGGGQCSTAVFVCRLNYPFTETDLLHFFCSSCSLLENIH